MIVHLVAPDEARRLVLVGEDGALPWMKLASWEFLPNEVTHINAWAAEHLHVSTTTLRHLAATDSESLVEIEVHDRSGVVALRWRRCEELANDPSTTAVTREALERLRAPVGKDRAPWERAGWYAETEAWLLRVLAAPEKRRVSSVLQVKGAWPRSAVIKASTSDGDFYLKADYRKPPFEGDVLKLLERAFPGAVPRVVHADEERRCTVMADFAGEKLSGDLGDNRLFGRPSDRELGAVRRFAELQVALSEQRDQLQRLGCRIWTGDEIVRGARALLEDDVLRTGAAALTADEIDILPRILRQAELLILRLERERFPSSLHNEDFRSGNIASTLSGYVYFDWSDVAVTWPFFSMVYYLYRRGHPRGVDPWDNLLGARTELKELWSAYLTAWRGRIGAAATDTAVETSIRIYPLYLALVARLELSYIEPTTIWAHGIRNYVPRAVRALWRTVAPA